MTHIRFDKNLQRLNSLSPQAHKYRSDQSVEICDYRCLRATSDFPSKQIELAAVSRLVIFRTYAKLGKT